jgi:hypothetical protein
MYRPGRVGDVIVQVVSAARHGRREASSLERQPALYDALIYSQLTLPVSPQTSSRYTETLRNLPLRGVERITLQPDDYTQHLVSFIEGEKGMETMRNRMLEAMSPALRGLLTEEPQQMRIWWHNVQPELEDYPWELTVTAERPSHQVAFLRGLPPETPLPMIPIADEPRIAMVGAQQLWPGWAHMMAHERPGMVVPIPGPLRLALREAVRQGFEVVHAFSDGVSTSALEGILYDHARTSEEAELSSSELSSILSGSRVTLLCLSPADYSDPDQQPIGGRNVLSVFRAFAYVGTAPLPLPTILAPLGPIRVLQALRFWKMFYDALLSTWNLTDSLRIAQANFLFSLPMALFCRHAGGKIFTRPDPLAPPENPTELRVDLLLSEQLTRELAVIDAKYKELELPESVKRLLDRESERQTDLRNTLDSWIDAVES